MIKSKGQRWRTVYQPATPTAPAPPAPAPKAPKAPRFDPTPAPLLDPDAERAARAAAATPAARLAAIQERARQFEAEGRLRLADAALARAAQYQRAIGRS